MWRIAKWILRLKEPEELIDVYDWRGYWTGETKPKSRVHADGDIHICVHGITTDGRGRILAQYRGSKVKLLRNMWDVVSVGGHISAMTPEERLARANYDLLWQAWRALKREFLEELGYVLPDELLDSDDCIYLGATKTDQDTEDGWRDRTMSFNFMLVLPDIDINTFVLEPGKVLAVRWMTADEVEAWLEFGTGEPLATREPDNALLLRAIVTTTREVQQERSGGE